MKGNALEKLLRFAIFELIKLYSKIKFISIGDENNDFVSLYYYHV